MRKIIYKVINSLGYKIENRKKLLDKELNYLSKFNATSTRNVLYRSRGFIKSINEQFPELKIENHENGFLVKFSNVEIFVESPEEFFIVKEVFVEKDYNFFTKNKATVIDIGANIGIASVFFSTLPQVDNIYSFEPVKDTYEMAKMNFKINEKIAKVAAIENIGLGGNNRNETFIFNRDNKGNSGVRGELSPSYAFENLANVKVDVVIKDSTEILNKIIESNANNSIVVKMDCEGAEYEIFENIVNSKIIEKIDVFMIEWHDKGSETIENELKKYGFNYFSRNLGPVSGMIYAYK